MLQRKNGSAVVAKKHARRIRRGEGVPARVAAYKVVPAVRHRPVSRTRHAAASRIHTGQSLPLRSHQKMASVSAKRDASSSIRSIEETVAGSTRNSSPQKGDSSCAIAKRASRYTPAKHDTRTNI